MLATRLRLAATGLVAAAAASLLLQPVTTAGLASAAAAAGPASVELEGRGYGHGRGMSQWGAQQAASEHGRTYRQILGFYYPGLPIGVARGRVRVLLTGDTTDDLVVRHRRGLVVRQVGTGDAWDLGDPAGAERWRLTAVDGGAATRISYFDGRWRPVRTVAGEAEIAARRGAVRLVTPAGSTRYPGALRSAAAPGGRDTVNVVRLDAYLRGVLPSEVYTTWHPQALQAQAVAARTYADYHRDHPRASYYDLCDTTSCQVYRGLEAPAASTDAAIRATAREVLLADGRAAFTEFSSSNGGWTVAGSVPYQLARQDLWDPVNPWTATIRARAIEHAFPRIGDFLRLRVLERDGNGAWNGRVLRVRVVGANGAKTLTGDAFRSTFGLRSTWFRQA